MNKDNLSKSSEMAVRFDSLEKASDFRRIVGSETIDIKRLPVILKLGETAFSLVILNPQKDLTEDERNGKRLGVGPNIETLIIDTSRFDPDAGQGLKAVRDGETVELGRSTKIGLERFDLKSNRISRMHVGVTKSPDGETITIEDHNTLNGTYIGMLPSVSAVDEISTEKFTEHRDNSPDMEPLKFFSRGSSIASERHPDSNEDSLIVDKRNNMYAVFDGLGGHAGGALASESAKRHIEQMVEGVDTFKDLNEAGDFLRLALKGANDNILRISPEAATTAVLAKIHRLNGELYASVAHVGDSRAYLMRDGFLKALTTDHTPYRKYYGTQGAMSQQERLANTDSTTLLSREDTVAFRERNIVSDSLGIDYEVNADVNHYAVRQGDAIILTSDGVHDNLTTLEMQDILANSGSTNYAEHLTRAASERSKQPHMRAKKDDITAVTVDI